MKRTVSIRILVTPEQDTLLNEIQSIFSDACNFIVKTAVEHKCSNKIELQHLCYYAAKDRFQQLGAQMKLKALQKVATAYKTLLQNRPEIRKGSWPEIAFRNTASVHYDKRLYSIRGDSLSLYTLQGRIQVQLRPGAFQEQYLAKGQAKEAELIRKRNRWYFNLVLDLPTPETLPSDKVLGVDMGENNLAATSSGKLFGGGKLRFERDKYLALRGRLDSNGSKSAMQLLKKVSGRESRHVRHVNHEVSKAIVLEAIRTHCAVIAMEDLTNIRSRIRAGKRVRARLHRWAWRELQTFIEYKAEAAGIRVVYVDPAYTSKTCAVCGNLGHRHKHRFHCPSCGRLAHADLNAGLNIASLGKAFAMPTGTVNCPNVAASARTIKLLP